MPISAKPHRALTGAERQAAYRARLRSGEKHINPRSRERLDVVTTISACAILKRLARHQGASPGDVLDRLLKAAEAEAVRDMTEAEMRAYY